MTVDHNIVDRLNALIPELEYSRETHIQWRDCDQRYRDENPDIGSAAFHDEQVKIYDERISAINEAIAALARSREAG